VNVLCEHCGLKYEDEKQFAVCPHQSFEVMDKHAAARGGPRFERAREQCFTTQQNLEESAGWDLNPEQRLELSNDLSKFWQSYPAKPDVAWLRTTFGLVRFSKAGVFVEIGEALGPQVRPITDKEYSLMVLEYPDIERVLLG
jgi:hypothetical protein